MRSDQRSEKGDECWQALGQRSGDALASFATKSQPVGGYEHGRLETGKGYIMASQDLLDMLCGLLDRTAVRHSSVEVGEKSFPDPGQAYRQVLHRRAERPFRCAEPPARW